MTGGSPHACAGTVRATGQALGSPLLATSNQWGHTPFPPTPMSRLAVSRQARDLLDGLITVHRELPVRRENPAVDVIARNHPVAPRPAYGPEQHRAALDRRRADIGRPADAAVELNAVDQRAAELDHRITDLLDVALARDGRTGREPRS